jgi:hypothetical protein
VCAERGATMFASSRVLQASLTEYIISIDYGWELWHSIVPMLIPSWHSRASTYLKRDRKAKIVGHCCWAKEGEKCSNNWKMLSRSPIRRWERWGVTNGRRDRESLLPPGLKGQILPCCILLGCDSQLPHLFFTTHNCTATATKSFSPAEQECLQNCTEIVAPTLHILYKKLKLPCI